MSRGFAFAALLGALALLASCAEDDDAGQSPNATEASPSATATPTSATTPTVTWPAGFDPGKCSEQITVEKCLDLFTHTPEPTPTISPPAPYYPAGTRTGVAEVDRLIQAIEGEDARILADLALFSTYPCEAQRPVQPQPLRCRDGQEIGDPLTGIWVTHVEGGLWPFEADGDREKLVPMFERGFANLRLGLHAVFRFRGDDYPATSWMPTPDYAVIFSRWEPATGPWFDTYFLRDGGLVSIEFAFAPLSPDRWDNPSDPGWLLERAR